MTMTAQRVQVSTFECPGCGGSAMCGIRNGLDTNIFCEQCAACWHMSLGTMRRVNPATCGSGCENIGRCTIAYAKDAEAEILQFLKARDELMTRKQWSD